MFLVSLNYFRAISILLIVMGHSFGLAAIPVDTLAQKMAMNIITGGTFLFVFISGVLFHHVFYSRFHYAKFMTGKIKYILIPYLLLSIPIVAWYVMVNDGWRPFFLHHGSGTINEYLIPALKYYWTGGAMVAYWYIPFILITFTMSPLHLIFIRQNTYVHVIVMISLIIISILIHRSEHGYNVLQNVVYFLPAYLIGIFSSIHKETLYRVMKGKEIFLFSIVLFLAALEAKTGHVGNYTKEPFVLNGIDIMFFQKIALCLFFMTFLHRFEGASNKLLDTIAATSFGIFFLHGYLLFIFGRFFSQTYIGNLTSSLHAEHLLPWIILIIVTAIIVTISTLIVLAIKKLLPKYSRYLTGY
jgi:hypothetical protein